MSHKIHIDLNTSEEVLRIKNTKLLQVFIYCKKVSNIAKLNLIFFYVILPLNVRKKLVLL